MAITLHDFTKFDWYGLSGCTMFPGGREPMVAYGVETESGSTDAMVVVDATGICIMIGPDADDALTLEIPGATRELLALVASHLPTPLVASQLMDLGFKD